jgi:hypothetical protein
MKPTMQPMRLQRCLNAALLSAALVVPVALTPFVLMPTVLKADDRSFHDQGHNDDHVWNDHEDKAYRIWVKDNHRKYKDFAKLNAEDQNSYWSWRHEHSDALLKIDIK